MRKVSQRNRMVAQQPVPRQNENLANTSKMLPQNRHQTPPALRYATRKPERTTARPRKICANALVYAQF